MLRQQLLALGLVVILALACGTISPAAPPAPTEIPATEVPPTAAMPPTETPIPPTPTPEVQQFFTEEFDKTLDYWSTYVVDGNSGVIDENGDPSAVVEIDSEALKFDLQRTWLWAYTIYQPFDYEGVRIDASFRNEGINNNNISLICRYVEGSGWYEFNIANNGLYWIYNAEPRSDGYVRYKLLGEGGSNAIKQGKATNDYTAICEGTTLTLFINGKETKKVDDAARSTGKIGVSVSSFDLLPIQVFVESVNISEP